MLDIMQDEDGVILRNGDFVLDGGIDGIAQQAEIRVGTNRGEWWLDETQGLPWIPGIMASRLPVSIVSNMINAEARRTQGSATPEPQPSTMRRGITQFALRSTLARTVQR